MATERGFKATGPTVPPQFIAFGNNNNNTPPRSPPPPISPNFPPSNRFPIQQPQQQRFNTSQNPSFQLQFPNFPRSPPPPPQQQAASYRPPRGFLIDSGGPQRPQQPRSLTWERNPWNNVSDQRPNISPPRWGVLPKSYSGDTDYQLKRGTSRNVLASTPAGPANFQGPELTRTPSSNKIYLDDFTQDVSERPDISPSRWGVLPKSYFGDTDYQLQGGTSHDGLASTPAGPAKFQGPERTRSPSSDKIYLDDFTQDVSARLPSDPSSFQALKKTRSSPSQSDNEIIWRNSQPSQGATNRIAASTNFGHTTTLVNKPNLTVQQKSPPFSPHNKGEGSGPKTKNAHVPKRNRSPSLASAEDHIPGTSYSSQDDTERETQAKAKRLARFGVELSQPMQRNLDHLKHKSPENRHDQTMMEKRKLASDQPMEASGDFMLADNEGLEASGVITGVCPDMCPESEREERERKGDLDKYERLDGNRNQSSTFLAVKKYNRTAEREAGLIRPMPVLQQTIEYLLSLLDEPYDDRFLGMYNFLWDRMRAIRMDLRMQHIFDEDAIIMLEQMIRLHIIAMHELCEYTKGEGFSEGFDAHLNIEQMNKTSVELFQMYDDHRKKGNILASEKEFRGYYALLKLDKHPGYKVEPAELSLDLAKMTPEIRQTPEILFAREVARACRTGNFIAFFRLARKATYLQACLMHAHFAKLRTQALASLHSGLQNNQGIPIAQVTKWLGMEEEDIEGLLEYHGFLIMEFEEPYMVKEGIFLNSDTDYPTKCSQLVHLKKSRSIVEDVSSSIQSRLPTEHLNQILSDKTVQPDSKAISYVRSRPSIDVVDEVMEEDPVLMEGLPVHPLLERPSTGLRAKSDHQVAERLYSSSPQHSPRSALSKKAIGGKPVQETLQNVSVERTMHSPVPLVPRIFMTELPQQSERFESDPHLAEVLYVSSPQQSPKSAEAKVVEVVKPAREAHQNDSVERTLHSSAQSVFLMSVTERPQPNERSEGYLSEPWLENSAPHVVIGPPENDESFAAHQLRDEEAMDSDHELENEEYMEMVQQGIDVKMTKLKLIIRKWKRFSTRLKELREKRQLAAYAALNSLTLGPPIQQIEAPSSHVPELDFDRASRARHERHKKSWSRTNISEVVGGILSERNPDAKCLCWKLIVCSQPMPTEGDMSVQESRTNYIAGLWLHSKLMGDMKDNDDELVVSSPDLSIWSNWFAHQYNNSPVCCLSIIREEKSTMVQDVRGASGILFLLSETIPFDVQKTKLDNLLMLLPSGSCLPLLILCVTQKVGSTSIINGLSLHDLDKTRISNFSVGFIVGDQPPGHLDGFLSTERLIEGLQWLASESPVQPVVHGMNTHELVMEHVSSSLEMLENVDVSVVGPNHCISVFNEVLDRSATEIATTAKTNPSGWPCPEITLLKSSNEHSAVNTHLPHVGWSSEETIRPILKKFQDCRLPSFTNDLSWLSRGSDVGEEILHHKEQLENCLIRYLTDSSKMMDIALATTEACVVLQKGAQLELEGSKYFIKPKWASIFRRIFNWRLMNLSNGVDSVAYIQSDTAISLKSEVEELNMGTSFGLLGSDNSELEVYGSFPSSPSLDEMVEVCYNTFQYGKEQSKSEASVLSPRVANGEETLHAATDSDNIDEEGIPPGDLEPTITGDAYSFSSGLSRREVSVDHHSREVVLTKKSSTKEADKLSKLLEQCNIVQNKIDKQLSIYF